MASLKCSSCGTLVNIDDRYCQNCGENNPKFVEVKTTTSSSSTSFSSNNSYSSTTPVEEGSGIGWFFLALCIPIIGFLIHFSLKDVRPNAASNSFAGAVINLVLLFIYFT